MKLLRWLRRRQKLLLPLVAVVASVITAITAGVLVGVVVAVVLFVLESGLLFYGLSVRARQTEESLASMNAMLQRTKGGLAKDLNVKVDRILKYRIEKDGRTTLERTEKITVAENSVPLRVWRFIEGGDCQDREQRDKIIFNVVSEWGGQIDRDIIWQPSRRHSEKAEVWAWPPGEESPGSTLKLVFSCTWPGLHQQLGKGKRLSLAFGPFDQQTSSLSYEITLDSAFGYTNDLGYAGNLESEPPNQYIGEDGCWIISGTEPAFSAGNGKQIDLTPPPPQPRSRRKRLVAETAEETAVEAPEDKAAAEATEKPAKERAASDGTVG